MIRLTPSQKIGSLAFHVLGLLLFLSRISCGCPKPRYGAPGERRGSRPDRRAA